MAIKVNYLLATLLVIACGSACGFTFSSSTRCDHVLASTWIKSKLTPSNVILKAGFGGGGGGKKNKKTASKLKPKQQWDRYGKLKSDTRFRVSVRVKTDDDSSEWLEVGSVKSKGDEYTEIAVARQRALIADHARRLFPLKVSSQDNIEWAYGQKDDEEWTVVDKNILETENVPSGIEKIIGFEGSPDPATGYYCVYNEGRLVTSESDMSMNRSSKKLQ